MTTSAPGRPERTRIVVRGAVPAIAPRVVLAAVAAVLCATQLPVGLWLVIAGVLAAFALVVPRLLTAWAFAFVIGMTMLFRDPSPTDWRPYLLLAGVHLVHLCAAQAVVTPVRGRIRLAVLVRPLRTFLAVQAPAQLILAVVLVLHRPDAAGWTGVRLPVVAAIGAAALIVLTVLLAISLRRLRGTDVGGPP